MDTKLIRQVREHLARRTEPAFNMGAPETCIMCDVRKVLGLAPYDDDGEKDPETYASLGERLGLNDKQAWELFYAASIPSQQRELGALTKSEALSVLDYIAHTANVGTVWAETLGVPADCTPAQIARDTKEVIYDDQENDERYDANMEF